MIFNTQRADITRRRFYHASDVTIVGHATTHTPIYMYSCFMPASSLAITNTFF